MRISYISLLRNLLPHCGAWPMDIIAQCLPIHRDAGMLQERQSLQVTSYVSSFTRDPSCPLPVTTAQNRDIQLAIPQT